jgi:hypothetical protein
LQIAGTQIEAARRGRPCEPPHGMQLGAFAAARRGAHDSCFVWTRLLAWRRLAAASETRRFLCARPSLQGPGTDQAVIQKIRDAVKAGDELTVSGFLG